MSALAATGGASLFSAIVVSADSGAPLRDCIVALLASDAIGELLLIDNASRDGMAEAMQVDHGDDARFRLIRNRRNIGFGAAVNRAAHAARGRWLLVVNPDCLVSPKALTKLQRHARTTANLGLAGATVRAPDGRIEPASRRRDPTLKRLLADWTGRGGEGVNVGGPIAPEILDVEAVSGALLLLPRRVFERLHGFDEGYFLHFEDLDLCRRVRDAGYRVVLAGDVSVVHDQGSSSHHRPLFVDWHKHRGIWRWLRSHDPRLRSALLRAPVWIAVWVHFMLHSPLLLWRGLRARRPSAEAG